MRRSAQRRLAVLAVTSALAAAGGFSIAYAGNFVEEHGSDFDCDGARDTVLGHENDAVNDVEGAGSVTVTYSGTGTRHRISQASAGVPGTAEEGDSFGFSHTSYDSNSDGCDDLVVGSPSEDIGSLENAGAVWVIPGSPTGLDTSQSISYSQNSSGFPGAAEAGDAFGVRLAGGITHSGVPFLLIVSGEENNRAGAVHYVRPDVIAILTQNSPGVPGTAEPDDFFGWSLSVSDRHFAIGSAIEGVSDRAAAGRPHPGRRNHPGHRQDLRRAVARCPAA